MAQLGRMGHMPRQRRGPRVGPLDRINIEVYPDELAGVREAKAWAMRRGQSFRAFVLEALAEKVAGLERLGAGA